MQMVDDTAEVERDYVPDYSTAAPLDDDAEEAEVLNWPGDCPPVELVMAGVVKAAYYLELLHRQAQPFRDYDSRNGSLAAGATKVWRIPFQAKRITVMSNYAIGVALAHEPNKYGNIIHLDPLVLPYNLDFSASELRVSSLSNSTPTYTLIFWR